MPIVPREWIRNPSDELAITEGCTFDTEPGEFVIDFIETFCRQSKGTRWSNQPLKLLPWQRDFLMRLFGWRRPDGTRRFRKAYLEVAKKNGKSTLLSALALVLLLIDDDGPEVYLNACDRDQATIIFEEARRMVVASSDLAARLKIINSTGVKRIVHEEGNGVLIANSSVAGAKDGLNPSATFFDELHRQKGRELWAVFEYAGAARDQPLRISITTAGEEEEGPWFEERDHSEKVNAGDVPDTTHLGVVYRCLPTDDLDDPEVWRKANPSLGQTINPEDFAREWESAKRDPIKRANFLRLRFNIVQRASAKFIDPDHWAACGGRPVNLKSLIRKSLLREPCWMGLDLSDTNDLTALALLFGDDDSGYDVLMRFWLPEENIVELEHQHGVPYRAWAEQGLITLTDGNVVDYSFVRGEIVRLAAKHNLRELWVDPYHAHKLAQDLAEQDGLSVKFIRQGFLSLSGPTKELDRLVRGHKLRHGDNPILRWMASNAIAVQDDAGNLKLSKKQSKKKIDGLAALVNAIAGATQGDGDGGGPSVYEQRGILIL